MYGSGVRRCRVALLLAMTHEVLWVRDDEGSINPPRLYTSPAYTPNTE